MIKSEKITHFSKISYDSLTTWVEWILTVNFLSKRRRSPARLFSVMTFWIEAPVLNPKVPFIFSGQWSKNYTFGYKTISAYLETQKTPRVIIAPAETENSSVGRYSSHQGLSVKFMSPERLLC